MALPLSLLILPAILSNPANAADLLVKFTSPGATVPTEFTFPGIKSGLLPGLVASAPDGSEYLVHVSLEITDSPEQEPDRVQIDAVVKQLKVKGKKGFLTMETVSNPRIVTLVGTPAKLSTGTRVPVPNTSPVEFQEYALVLEMLVTEQGVWP